jgi:hypothetical protein
VPANLALRCLPGRDCSLDPLNEECADAMPRHNLAEAEPGRHVGLDGRLLERRACGPLRTQLRQSATPACCLGFLLGAEPAFAGALIDLRAAVERVAGHVVDALA